MKRFITILLTVLTCLALHGTTPEKWTFLNAGLSPDPATGTITVGKDGITLETELPSKRSCGWWESEFSVQTGKGAHFTAVAEITPGEGVDDVYNDVMMFVTWYDPHKGNNKSASFYQRDYMRYTDEITADGRILRRFDDVFAVPGDCNTIRMELISKWHPMSISYRDIKVEPAEAPGQRLVRCVVPNPFEKKPEDFGLSWDDPEAVMKARLGQFEACLEKVEAEVEHPDIILFSENFIGTGAPQPRDVAESIPDGPSFRMAARWAVKLHCYIAMNIKEVSDEGTYHNTTFICDRQGQLAGIQRKTTLTSGEYFQGLLPDPDYRVFNLDFGCIGALTCWENWFSETAKFLKRRGAELLLFPLAGCTQDHVDIVFPARAIDTGLPFMVSMRQGKLPNGIIDRDGVWIASTMEDGAYAVADIDLNERKRVRSLSVGHGMGDPYELYYDESRPEIYEKQEYGPRR